MQLFLPDITARYLFLLLSLTLPGLLLAADNVSEKSSQPETTQVDASAWDNFAPPRDDKFDWVQLTSEEWLKGEIISLFNYSLRFDSDELGVMDIDWEDIRQIRSAGTKSMLIDSKQAGKEPFIARGKLHVKTANAVIVDGDNVVVVERDQLVSIASGTQKESDYWSGNLDLGANIKKGNTDTVDSNLAFNIARRTAASRFIIDYRGNFSKASGIETSNNHRANSYLDKFFNSRFFWRTIYIEYYRDTFKNIDQQISVGTLAGYEIIRNTSTEWEIGGGPGYFYKRSVSTAAGEDPESTSPFLMLGTRVDIELTSWLDYLLEFRMQFVNTESGGYTHHFLTTLSSDLLGNLDLDVSLIWDRIAEPQTAADGTVPEKDDYQIIVAISYEF
jgi:hypothetical protein